MDACGVEVDAYHALERGRDLDFEQQRFHRARRRRRGAAHVRLHEDLRFCQWDPPAAGAAAAAALLNYVATKRPGLLFSQLSESYYTSPISTLAVL